MPQSYYNISQSKAGFSQTGTLISQNLAGNSQSRLETLPNSARKLPKLAGNSQS